jgi:hypothetical protein
VPLLAFKLLMTPVFIGGVSWAGRRWGPAVSGLLMGLPLTSGPISVFLALQHGPGFAARTAAGQMAGQASACVFYAAYGLGARRLSWPRCAVLSLLAFLAATALLNCFPWGLAAAAALLLAAILAVARILPQRDVPPASGAAPRWDLPGRMIAATLFLLGLTACSRALGPQLSGLLSPFPIYGVVLAAFAHHNQGAEAAAQLVRGNALGSVAFVAFFLVTGFALGHLPLAATYLLAAVAALAAHTPVLLASRPGANLPPSAQA